MATGSRNSSTAAHAPPPHSNGGADAGPGPARRAPLLLAGLCFAVLSVHLLVAVGRPLATDDLWFHLKMGEVYSTETLWPAADPMLHTAGDRRPVQHEWLFGVTLFGLERTIGFQGLRVLHVLVVFGIVWLVFWSFRRESRAALPAILATSVFVVLAWPRLYQLRPDLVSIPAAIAIYHLLLRAEPGPSWRRVAIAVLLIGVWANAHSLFAIGLALGVAACIGILATRVAGLRLPAAQRPAHQPSLGRVTAALVLGGLAALLNPRGVQQHLTFFSSSRDSAIWLVKDEWAAFRPFTVPGEGLAPMDMLAWLTTDALLLLLVLTAVVGGLAFLRRPTRERLRAADPLLGALAFASAVALVMSVRFLWMSFFILLFLLHVNRPRLASCSRKTVRRIEWAMAAAALLLTLGFARLDVWRGLELETRREPASYLASSYLTRRYCAPGIRFLEEAGLEGNLFNPYHLGGYAGYRLAPRVRTFIDGRTEHYPKEVVDDYLKVISSSSRFERSDVVEVLDEREVDIFLGVGLTYGYYANLYTVELLAEQPGWIAVYRNTDHAIYLRDSTGNARNLLRVEAYYRERGVPFDRQAGFRALGAIEEAPAWAIEQGLIPPDFAERAAPRESPDLEERFRALDFLGTVYWQLGEYPAAVEANRAAVGLRPDAKEPRRRLAIAYVRQRRFGDAERAARELYDLDPHDPRSKSFLVWIATVRRSR